MTLTLRRARPDDSAALLAWRNDPETRAMSLTTHEVGPDEHAAWFARRLSLPGFWIAEVDGERIGTVRHDGRLSWTVAPEHRRKGYGAAMVALAVGRVGRGAVQIKPENTASLRIAERCGLNVEPV